MNPGSAILSIAYFPPVQYLTKFLLYEDICIEKHENYSKQTYRNRCIIMSANGPLTLSIPIRKEISPKIPIAQARLDYDTPWNRLHWKAIETAYRCSPFYEFYIDDFAPFFIQKHKYLFEFNISILEIILKQTGISRKFKISDKYLLHKEDAIDYRNNIHPKPSKDKEDQLFRNYGYKQVFSEKYGFVPNLSILDLLFNEGPNSFSILRNHLPCPVSI